MGDKSFKEVQDKLLDLGIDVETRNMNSDFNFIFEFLGIDCDVAQLNGTYEIEKNYVLKVILYPIYMGEKI